MPHTSLPIGSRPRNGSPACAPKPKRDPAAFETAEALKQAARDARFAFLRRHARTLYDRLTNAQAKFVRIERLAYDAAEMVPGLVPTGAEVDGRGRAAPGRQGRLRDRPGHPVQPVPGRSRSAACISATPCCCRARNRPRRWPSSCATASSISASPGSSARARRPCCSWPTSASSTPRTIRPSPPPRSPPTSASSTRKARSPCCAARSCPRASMPAAASSTPASTSRTSTTARSRSCGSWSATWAS